jgi:hypothetical protein
MACTSVHSVVKPLYYASVLFGLAPVSWYIDKKRCLHVGLWIVKQLWAVSLTSSLFPLMIYSMYLSYPRNGSISRIIGFAIFHILLYSSGAITLLSRLTMKRNKVRQLLCEISQVDRVLVVRGIGPSMYTHTRSSIVMQLFLVFAIVISLWVLDLYNYCGLDCYNGFFGLVPFLVNAVEIVQFLNFVLILRKKYELLNEYLTSSLSVSGTYGNRKIPVAFPAVNLTRNKIFEVKPSWNKSNEPELELHHLRNIYSYLYDISHLISSTYGISLLGIITWLFTYSIACMLFALRHFSHGKYPVAVILLCALSLCFLAAITVPCQVTIDEANRSPVLIQKLLLRRDICERSTSDLDRFYNQLNSMSIKFTACGFFSLDMPMFCAIAGGICTYVIVISQLK